MVEKCFFNISFRSCMALTYKNCKGCNFYKTREEFEAGKRNAEEILKQKGLEPYLCGNTMTTRKIRIKNEYDRIFTKEIGDNEK